MVLKLFSKTALLGGAGGAIYLSNSIDISDTLPPKQLNLKSTSFTKPINSLEDIKLYEKFHHCNFVFIDSWTDGTMYNFEKFLNKHNTDNWKKLLIRGSDSFKEKCREKKVVTLAFNRDRKVFELKV